MKKLSIFSLTLALLITFLIPNIAKANRQLLLVNKAPFKIFVAYSYQDKSSNWIQRGWQAINARDAITLTVATNNNVMYLFAQSKANNAFWSGRNDDSNDRTYTVVDDAFKVFTGNVPKGKNRAKRRFNKISLQQGKVTKHTFNYNR